MRYVLWVIVLAAAATSGWGDSPAVPGAGVAATQGAGAGSVPDAMTRQMREAAAAMGSPDAAERDRAMKALEAALAEQAAALAGSESPEVHDRIALVLSRNAAVAKYLRGVFARPAAECGPAVQWALGSPERSLLVAGVHSSRASDRIAAAEALADLKVHGGAEGDVLLGALIRDRSPEVLAAAMESAIKRGASESVVAALWKRGVADGWMYKRVYQPPQQVKFRGKPLGGIYDPSAYNQNVEAAAADTLVALKSPLVEKRVVAFLEELARDKDPGPMQFLMPYYPAVQNLQAMIEAYKPRAAVPVLMRLMSMREQNQQDAKNLPGGDFYVSSHTLLMVMVLKITEQDPEEYQLALRNDMGMPQWAAPGAKAHAEALAKLKTWYASNKDKFETERAGPATSPTTAGTAPATKPANRPG